MSIRYEDVLFAYDFDTTLVQGGVTYLKDWGPNKCHLSLGAATAPTRTTAIDGVSYTFNGTTNFVSMDATTASRFWGALVDGHTDYCIIAKLFHRAPALNDYIFSTFTAALNVNFGFAVSDAGAERHRLTVFNAAAAQVTLRDNADVPLTGRTRTMVFGGRMRVGLAMLDYYRLYDGGRTVTGSTTSTGVPGAFDRTALPTIGRLWSGGASNYFDGRLYYLALLKALPTPREVEKYSSALMDGIYKPWCVR